MLVGIPGYFLLPNYPHNTAFLSEAESALAQYRLARENDGENDEVKESVFIGLKQAVADPKVWLLVLILTGAVVSMSFTCESSPLSSCKFAWQALTRIIPDFFPSIVQTLGYPRVETLLLTAPPYFLACVFSITNSWHSGKTQERCFHIVTGAAISIVGQVISMSTYNTGARYFVSNMDATITSPSIPNFFAGHVPPSYGVVLHLPAYSLVDFVYHSSTQGEACCGRGNVYCHLERHQHQHRVPLPLF